ncbi:MAG: helix-turn-helix domain-containing protein, partial [Kiritimatiellae bacterium]|nr:helix-turn-helix domain-containing protein [Kiritimatiellia bacterium]
RTAASMLLRTKASVHAIARKTGFASDAHFVRLFRRKTGSTPSAYRAVERPDPRRTRGCKRDRTC